MGRVMRNYMMGRSYKKLHDGEELYNGRSYEKLYDRKE